MILRRGKLEVEVADHDEQLIAYYRGEGWRGVRDAEPVKKSPRKRAARKAAAKATPKPVDPPVGELVEVQQPEAGADA